ncbi:MAG: carboxymuconolactone decarboxylase family protein [Thermoguttaceae bacterium]
MAKSPQDVLADVQNNLPKLQKMAPEVTADFVKRLMPDVLKDGALSTKVKELIALGIAVCATCDYCIAMHVKKCLDAGATKSEIAEALGVALLMGGGPALTYSAFAAAAVEQFSTEKTSS